jgi:hypothetical protein
MKGLRVSPIPLTPWTHSPTSAGESRLGKALPGGVQEEESFSPCPPRSSSFPGRNALVTQLVDLDLGGSIWKGVHLRPYPNNISVFCPGWSLQSLYLL